MKNKIFFSKCYSFNNQSFEIKTRNSESFSIEDINEIAACYNMNEIKTIKNYYDKLFNTLKLENINHQHILSKKMKSDYLNHVKENLSNISPMLLPYFKNVYSVRKHFLKKLRPLMLNEISLDVPMYSHDTKTGRSRILSGHNYMTMKKEKRKLLKHIDKERILLEIDFNSCEPVFYFNFMDKKPTTGDLYSIIKKDLEIKESRKSLKTAIISILYGAGYDTVKKISKIDKASYNKIKDYMMIDKFHDKVKIENNSMIKNYYGRPIMMKNEKNKINYWVQSSVADYVYLSFNKFCKDIESFQLHAIIHDAMIFSVNKSDWFKIKSVKEISEDISNYKIAVKIEPVSDN